MINDWLARWPNANWALRTGPETGFTVIDIDPGMAVTTRLRNYSRPVARCQTP
jgi:hypothetical protein